MRCFECFLSFPTTYSHVLPDLLLVRADVKPHTRKRPTKVRKWTVHIVHYWRTHWKDNVGLPIVLPDLYVGGAVRKIAANVQDDSDGRHQKPSQTVRLHHG